MPFTGCRPSPADSETLPLHAILVGFNIRYSWQIKDKKSPTVSEDDSSNNAMRNWMNPFSPQLSLPYLTMVNNAVERFTTFHVVKLVIFIAVVVVAIHQGKHQTISSYIWRLAESDYQVNSLTHLR